MPLRRSACPVLAVLALALGATTSAASAADEPPVPAKPTKQQCVEANESAQDLQGAGKLLDAEAKLVACADLACPGVVRDDCVDRLRKVRAAIPTVVFVPKDAGGASIGGAGSVEVDGAQTSPLDGTPVRVDPGEHTFELTIAGRRPEVRRLSLLAGERLRREVIFRGEIPAAPRPEPDRETKAAPVEPPSSPPLPARGATGAPTPVEQIVGYSALGAGGAGIALTAVFGLIATGKKSSLETMCAGHDCPPAAQADVDGLHFDAVAANVALAVGVLGVGVGLGALLLWPQIDAPGAVAVSVTPWVGLGRAGMSGSFR